MNDRYLYRAKRKNWRELPKEVWWVEGYYAFVDNHHYIYTGNLCNGGLYVVAERFEIDIAPLCACTGLKDKNGKLIFENDIVRCGKNCTVTWCDTFASWRLNTSRWMHSHFFGEACEPEDVEIVGNIFDNPELLEVGE